MMVSIGASEAKNNFGELIDIALREPVTVERHGRPVVVVISKAEYDQIKLERLRAKIALGAEQAKRGEFSDKTVADIIKEGKERHNET